METYYFHDVYSKFHMYAIGKKFKIIITSRKNCFARKFMVLQIVMIHNQDRICEVPAVRSRLTERRTKRVVLCTWAGKAHPDPHTPHPSASWHLQPKSEQARSAPTTGLLVFYLLPRGDENSKHLALLKIKVLATHKDEKKSLSKFETLSLFFFLNENTK